MIFHSLDFLVFFVITLAAYWSLPLRGQNVLLLAASHLFYGWVHPWFLGLIFATTFIDYWSARSMAQRPEHKKAWLWLSIITNFGMLGLVAGPIMRATNLLPQFERERLFSAPSARGRDGADGVGVLQEAGDCRQRRGDRQQGVYPGVAGVPGTLGRCLRFCDPEPCRLLGLHRHRARGG